MNPPDLDYEEEMTKVAELLDRVFPGPFCLLLCEPIDEDADGTITSKVHRIHNFHTDEDCEKLLSSEKREMLQ